MLLIVSFPVPLESSDHWAREVEKVVPRINAFAGKCLKDVR